MPDYRNRPPVDHEREIVVNWWAVVGLILIAASLGGGVVLLAIATEFLKP